MKKTLINLGLFQLGWLVCVLSGDLYAGLYVLVALLIHHWLVVENPREWLLIGSIAVVGSLWDIAMVQSGQILYPDSSLAGIPWWLISLWLLFATTFAHCLSWLRNYLWLAALLAAVFGPRELLVRCEAD